MLSVCEKTPRKNETEILAIFFVYQNAVQPVKPPVQPVFWFVSQFHDIAVYRPFRTGHITGSRLNRPVRSGFNHLAFTVLPVIVEIYNKTK